MQMMDDGKCKCKGVWFYRAIHMKVHSNIPIARWGIIMHHDARESYIQGVSSIRASCKYSEGQWSMMYSNTYILI